MGNAINWFEIPAVDFDRAVAFYKEVLGTSIRREDADGMLNGIFEVQSKDSVTGAIVRGDGFVPSTTGAVVYLNTETPDNFDKVLARVEPAGGKVVVPRTSIGDPGYIAVIIDSEGNRVGLHCEAH